MTESETIQRIGDLLSEAWKILFAYWVHSNPTYLGKCRALCLDAVELLDQMLES